MAVVVWSNHRFQTYHESLFVYFFYTDEYI